MKINNYFDVITNLCNRFINAAIKKGIKKNMSSQTQDMPYMNTFFYLCFFLYIYNSQRADSDHN